MCDFTISLTMLNKTILYCLAYTNKHTETTSGCRFYVLQILAQHP